MKKVNKLGSIVLLSAVVLAAGATVSEAAPANSKASVEFQTSDVPLDFADAKATNISFGKVNIEGNNATYDAIYTGDKFTEFGGAEKFASPSVTVKDDRGTMPGYHVEVAMTKQFTHTDNTSVIRGAEVEVSTTSAKSAYDTAIRKAPTSFESNVKLGDGIANQRIFGANATEGAGTWTFFMGDLVDSDKDSSGKEVRNNKVKLHVPGGNSIKTDAGYTADLTWTLIDA